MNEFTHNIKDATHFQEYPSGMILFKWRQGAYWYWNDTHKCYEPICGFEADNLRLISDLLIIDKLRNMIERALEDSDNGV